MIRKKIIDKFPQDDLGLDIREANGLCATNSVILVKWQNEQPSYASYQREESEDAKSSLVHLYVSCEVIVWKRLTHQYFKHPKHQTYM